ncbi:MAG: hypothetical protein NC311_10010 [Muribaculaceae bacterium]|nr:hypothetical protein [Muribaculaceae bacterium]
MNQKYMLIRLLLLGMSVILILFTSLSGAMAQFRDFNFTIGAMGVSLIYAILRGMLGQDRREAQERWESYHDTTMAWTAHTAPYMRSAIAWAACDALWIASDGFACLTWGIPGAMALIFQALFFIAFKAAVKFRPDLYKTPEQAQAADMTESAMYACACVALAVYAWFTSRA